MKKINEITKTELRQLMTGVARYTEGLLPPGTLFVTIVFADPGLAQYVSNTERSDVVGAMRKYADQLERERGISR